MNYHNDHDGEVNDEIELKVYGIVLYFILYNRQFSLITKWCCATKWMSQSMEKISVYLADFTHEQIKSSILAMWDKIHYVFCCSVISVSSVCIRFSVEIVFSVYSPNVPKQGTSHSFPLIIIKQCLLRTESKNHNL